MAWVSSDRELSMSAYHISKVRKREAMKLVRAQFFRLAAAPTGVGALKYSQANPAPTHGA
jgi:hypothetical protein